MRDTVGFAPEARTAPAILDDVPAETLQKNLSEVLSELSRCARPGQPTARLVAVTKTVSARVIGRLGELGVRDIGENRVQVALPKLTAFGPEFRLHWIGRLQTNKVKDIIDQVWLLHSLDRPALAEEVERRADQRGLAVPALLQVNIAGEAQKAGFAPEDVRPFLRRMTDYHSLRVRGLMAMMPLIEDETALRSYFRDMRTLFDRLREEAPAGVVMEELSMGMSHDYRLAAQEGATLVRVGTALFR